jgi:hypothetical protein
MASRTWGYEMDGDWLGDVPTWLATLVALGALGFAFVEKRSAELAQAENKKLQERQQDLDRQAWVDSHFAAVREWANQVCLVLSKATHLAYESQPDKTAKREILCELSALLDTGRWYFPNQWAEEYGVEKETAYRGIRQPVLDCMALAYEHLSKPHPAPDLAKQLVKCQRFFVSHIQQVLDPRQRDVERQRILEGFADAKRLRDAPGKAEKVSATK